MNIIIREMDQHTVHLLKKEGSSFEVRSKLVLHTDNDRIGYTVVDLHPYTKQYEAEDFDPATYISNPDGIVFFACLEHHIISGSRNDHRKPENRGAGVARTPVFGYPLNFREVLIIGQIRLLKYWNGYAYIADIATAEDYRGEGIGRALIQRAIEWAKSKGLPGIMLETQNNNVAACCLYERCGFELRGFDTHLYKALDPTTDEIALYWYLIF